MIRLLLIFLLPLALNASKILSYNIYDRTDRADVMITFDTPYEGVIKQSISQSKIIIKLTDAKIESAKLKKLSSKYLHSLNITPMSGYTQIVASVSDSVTLKASKTSDAYGLRLRFSSKAPKQVRKPASDSSNILASLPTKKDGEMTQSYYIVIAILIVGIVLLLMIKRRAVPKNKQSGQNSWLFKENQSNQPNNPSQQMPTASLKDDNVSIRFQKSIDSTNSVVMLDFGEQSYLVLMGASNILLDKFTDNKPVTQEDFETILQNRHQELDEFLSLKDETKEPLQAYKERAASISYEV
jgi:Tfp pilus assembly protein PilN